MLHLLLSSKRNVQECDARKAQSGLGSWFPKKYFGHSENALITLRQFFK